MIYVKYMEILLYNNLMQHQNHLNQIKQQKALKIIAIAENQRKIRHHEEKAKKAALMTNYDIDPFYNFNNENEDLIEGFANFNSKPKPQVEVIKQEAFDEELRRK